MTRAAAASAASAPPAPQRRPEPARLGREPRSGATPRRRRRQSPPAAALPVRLVRGPAGRAARARAAGVLDALLSGRAWIALIGILLAGIVFLNVDLLQRGRSIAATAERSAELQRENAGLRSELAELGSAQRIQRAAAEEGMVLPVPGDVRYVRARPADARLAARRTSDTAYTAAPAARPQELLAEPADGALATAPFGAGGATAGAGSASGASAGSTLGAGSATGTTAGAGSATGASAGSTLGAGAGSATGAGAGSTTATGAGSATATGASAGSTLGAGAVAPPAAVAGVPR